MVTDRTGALTVKHGTSKPRWKPSKKGIRCHYCQRLGHIQKDCYEREKYKSKKQQTQKVNKTSVKRESEHEDIGLVVSQQQQGQPIKLTAGL